MPQQPQAAHLDCLLKLQGFDQLPADFVAFELRRLTMLWQARQPMGLTGLPDAVLALPERERLAWLFGRRAVDGVDPAGLI